MLKIGIAGYGVIGKRRREFIDRRDDMKVVAISDKVFDGQGTMQDGTRYYNDYKDIIEAEKDEIDALFVCLTNDVAPDATINGLEKGMHVFCEKPPGRDLSDIQRVINTEKQYSHLKLKYGFNHRYHLSVVRAKEIIESGHFGKIVNMRGVYGKSKIINFDANDWRSQRQYAGGGILLDQGIHMVDLMRYFAGDFTEFKSFISNDFWNHDVEDNAYCLMKTEDNVIGMLHSTATEWLHNFKLDICMQKGALQLKGILSGSKSYAPELLTIITKAEEDNGDPLEETIKYNRDPSWQDEIEDFVDAIVNNRLITEGSSKDAFKTMKTVYSIYCADDKWKEKYGLSDEPENKRSHEAA